MTDKRFYIQDEKTVKDSFRYISENGYVFSFKNDAEKVCDLLNELHEENNELKFELEECREHKLFSRRQLEEENEKLKSELRNLRRLANEIYMEKTE